VKKDCQPKEGGKEGRKEGRKKTKINLKNGSEKSQY